jgi:hypothetical protein
MNKKSFLMGILVMALVFGMTFVGCDNGTSGSKTNTPTANTDPKVLKITGFDASYLPNTATAAVALYPAGTALANIMNGTAVNVAGALGNNGDITRGSDYTIPLYKGDSTGRWTGNGKYDVYVIADMTTGTKAGVLTNVDFSTATKTVAWSGFTTQ